MTYLPFVDGLRAVAVLAVVLFHAFPSLMPGGFTGVDIFFVISGFLITRFILDDVRVGRFSLKSFYIRRARRLLPAAVVCFLSVAALSGIVLLPDAYHYFGRSLLASILMYANIFFYATGGYFSAPASEKPLLHIWSLAVEDQFYLTWPPLIILLQRFRPRMVVALVFLLAFASLTYAEIKIITDTEYAFFQLPTRAWELFTGSLLALIPLPTFRPAFANALALTGTTAMISSFWLVSSEGHFPGFGAVPACVGTAAILASSLTQSTWISRLLSLRPTVAIGRISYSLYLWHWPLLALLHYRLERQPSQVETLLTVGLAFVLAFLSWLYVEQPFRHPIATEDSRPQSNATFVWQAVGATLIVVGIAMVLKISHGLPQRYDAKLQPLLRQMIAENPLRSTCDNYQNVMRHDDVCGAGRRKSAQESYEMALFGDSMADQWIELAKHYAEKHNLALRQVTNGGCMLLFGTDIPARPSAKKRECVAYVHAAQDFVANNPDLKLAVISGYWEKWIGRIENPRSRDDVPAAEQGDDQQLPIFDNVLKQTVEAFTAKGIKVVLIGQIPVYDVLPLRCIAKAIESDGDVRLCGMSSKKAERQVERSNAALLRLAGANPLVSVSLPQQAMCSEATCSPFLNGTFLYRNGSHLNSFGAAAFTGLIAFPTLP